MLSVKISLDKQKNLFAEQDERYGHSLFAAALTVWRGVRRKCGYARIHQKCVAIAVHVSSSVDEDVIDPSEMSALRMSLRAQSLHTESYAETGGSEDPANSYCR